MIYKIVNPNTVQIEYSYEADEIQQYGGSWGSYLHISVPEGLDPDCVKAELNENDEIILVEDADKVAAKVLADKATRIKARETACDNDIQDQQVQIYGFQSQAAAIRTHIMWQDMVENPSSWISEQLATEEAVLAYATPLLGNSKTFGQYCVIRVAQYEAEKAAIEAE